MHLDIMTTYRLQLTPEEMSTLGKALHESSDPKAKELNVAIQRSRHKQMSLVMDATTHIWESAEFGGKPK